MVPLMQRLLVSSHYRCFSSVTVPEETKILIGEVTSVDLSEEFAHEKLSPVLAMYKAEDFEDALSKAEHLIADGGFGHTSSLYINVETQADKIAEFSERMKTCRCLINTRFISRWNR